MSLSYPFPSASSPTSIPPDSFYAECTAPVNIAVIKYWGKRDTRYLLPINSSLSATMDQNAMKAHTLIIASHHFTRHTLMLNGKEEALNDRLRTVIEALQSQSAPLSLSTRGKWKDYYLKIISVNNFPTAAGLASSAAGYACFTVCLAALYGFQERYPGQLTAIARQGSGSACRSLHSGWVRWTLGSQADGSDSIASQVVDDKHWPEMRVLILVVNAAQKETSSTEGMQRSVETSELLAYRASHVVAKRMALMEQALQAKDFPAFARLTMQDSNQFHACCLDTYPPIFYLNETSKHVISTITAINENETAPIAAYTFDAGPNAVVYVLDQHMHKLLALFENLYSDGSDHFVYDPMQLANQRSESTSNLDSSWLRSVGPRKNTCKVYQIIVSKVGEGAKIIHRADTFDDNLN